VLTNLISNAIDAMPNGGQLLLEIDAQDHDAHIKVGDTGHGIRPEAMSEIFKPFFTTKGEKGLGVGLWVSRSIVHKLGGSIEVRSSIEAEHHGTWFTVCLPLAGSEPRMGEQRLAS
jgi:signal transduction histidine kinase